VTFLGDDGALLAGVRAGNSLAMAALYDRYVGDVRRILLHTLGATAGLGRPGARRLHQRAHVGALGARSRALRSWLFQVTVRTARKHLRGSSRRWWLKLWPEGDELDLQPAAMLEENASDAVQATFRILKGMEPEDRLVFSLRYVSGLDLSEMAEACEMSLSTLKRRLARAEQRFHAKPGRDDALRGWADGSET
jgi:RNA polymerase sigma-70 factor (ECF subfamily)